MCVFLVVCVCVCAFVVVVCVCCRLSLEEGPSKEAFACDMYMKILIPDRDVFLLSSFINTHLLLQQLFCVRTSSFAGIVRISSFC